MNDSDRFNFPRIKTPRLILRVLTLEDVPAVYQHFSDDDVTRFMDLESCRSLDDAREIITFHINDTGCRWGVFDRATGDLLGTCGYHCWVTGTHAKAEIGYDLGRAYWGRGLMKETLQAAITFGFETMHLTRIEADLDRDNVRSIGLLKNLGFQEEKVTEKGLLRFCLLNRPASTVAHQSSS